MKISPSVTPGTRPLSSEADVADVAIELQRHGSSEVARSASISSVNDPQVLAALESTMREIFAPHETPENREALTALVKDRASQLQSMGQTAEDVGRLLDKAARMDRVTAPIQGAVAAVPFAVGSTLIDMVPKITEKAAASVPYSGFIAGALSGAADVVLCGMLARATHDTAWLKAPPDMMEPVMQHAQSALGEGTSVKRGMEQAAAFQTYSLRNVARGLVAATVTATKGPAAAALADTVLTTAGGLLAGAGYGTANRTFDLAAHRAGPEYLFGRTKWKEQYEALRDCSPSRDPLINVGKRLAKLPLDILTDTFKSLGNATSASSIINNGVVLGGGFALAAMARSAVRTAAGSAGLSPVSVVAVDHATNVGVSGLIFGAYGLSSTTSGLLSEAAAKALQEDVPPKVLSAAVAAGGGVTAGAKAAVSLGESAVKTLHDDVQPKVLSAAVTVGEGMATGVKAAATWLGSGAEAGSNAVAGFANRIRQRPARNVDPQGGSDV